MERDPLEGGSDVGRGVVHDLGDEPPPLYRDTAPDVLAPIDETAPVSGHVPPPEQVRSAVDTPEHDWERARALIRPAFRPVGTQGLPVESFQTETLLSHGSHHAQPLLDVGPAGLPVVYTMSAGAFDIVVNGEHLLSWGVQPVDLQDAALQNLAAWSAGAAWTDEVSGEHHLISSETGDGTDAVRILLPDVVEHLTRALGGEGRILIGIPERHLLTAASLRPGDEEFAAMFSEFIVEQSGGADEPIDRRVFELVDGHLVEYDAAAVG